MSHVYLIGFMGAGKSTVGRKLSRRLGLPFVDMDAQIEKAAGISVSEVFATRGESVFRQIEHDVLQKIARRADSVVACGGGIVIKDENRTLLKESGTVFYLRVSAAEAIARISDSATRPLLSGAGGAVAATALLDARKALYSAVSDHDIDTSGHTPEQVADEVAAILRSQEAS